jgi:hypothetical protein
MFAGTLLRSRRTDLIADVQRGDRLSARRATTQLEREALRDLVNAVGEPANLQAAGWL